MNILKIVIKGEYFDLIAAKKKKIEYRDASPFWRSRLYDNLGKKRSYDKIEFINNYNKNATAVVHVRTNYLPVINTASKLQKILNQSLF